MTKQTLILGIETSCDETAAAIIADGRQILTNVVSSQVEWHRRFGGVVPEIAARRHLELINPVIAEALLEAAIGLGDLNAIAVSVGPGLVGALLVGLAAAKALSLARDVPLVGVNHLEGHIYANFLEHDELAPPFVSLVVSGGHTVLVYFENHGRYQILGETLDDAAGEAFDKIAGFLGLGYPGGPVIDKLAKEGNPEAIHFPRALLHSHDYNFSLSGLKTAVLNYVSRSKKKGEELSLADVCASFQAAIVEVQVRKTIRAALEKQVDKIVLGGGVAANEALRQQLGHEASRQGIALFYPSPGLCTDNAAMIACAGHYRWQRGERLGLEADVNANLKLG